MKDTWERLDFYQIKAIIEFSDTILTRPLNVVGIAQVFWGSCKHLTVGHWGPEGNHIVSSIMAYRSIFQGILCEIYNKEQSLVMEPLT